MKKMFTLILMFSSLCCSQIVGPKISTHQMQFDFGKIKNNEKVTHDFIIYNTGGDTLEIKDVRAGCGCTAAKPDKNKLIPGESANINVKFDPFGRKGHQQKYVYISSNDKDTPELRLTFTADIEEEIPGVVKSSGAKLQLEYATHDFGIIQEGKVVEWTVSFKNVGDAILEIKDVKTSCGCTAAVVSGKSIKPGESGSLKIEFDSNNKSGKISKTVSIVSNDVINSSQTVVITADIQKKVD
ncbi:MAG: DUF1573 domain-containing protein [Ignavibacteriales bacterium]|nr:DUF1573 domain-containing protein [Ignavibacteriales bacterium]